MKGAIFEDNAFTTLTSLPAAGANVNTPSIELSENANLLGLELMAEFDEMPELADGKSVTVKVQDSDDGETFADVKALGAQAVTGASGEGNKGNTQLFWPVPRTLRKHIRYNVAHAASGGTITAYKVKTTVLFP